MAQRSFQTGAKSRLSSSNQSWRYFELTDPAFDVELYNDHDVYYDFDDYKLYCIPSGLYGQEFVHGWTIVNIDECILTTKQLDRLLTMAIKTYKKHESTLRLEKKKASDAERNRIRDDICYG